MMLNFEHKSEISLFISKTREFWCNEGMQSMTICTQDMFKLLKCSYILQSVHRPSLPSLLHRLVFLLPVLFSVFLCTIQAGLCLHAVCPFSTKNGIIFGLCPGGVSRLIFIIFFTEFWAPVYMKTP